MNKRIKELTAVTKTLLQLGRRLKEISDAKDALNKQEMDTRAAYYDLLVKDAIRSGFLNEAEWTVGTHGDKIYLCSRDSDHKNLIKQLGPVFGGWGHATVQVGTGVELNVDDGQLTLRETHEYWTDPKRKSSPFLIQFAKETRLCIVTGERSDQEERQLRDKLASFEKMKELAKSLSGVKP